MNSKDFSKTIQFWLLLFLQYEKDLQQAANMALPDDDDDDDL